MITKGLTLGLLLVSLGSTSYAESLNPFSFVESKPINEVWVNAGMQSYHPDKDQKFNNNNIGVGAEYAFSTVASLTVGTYNNSVRNQTNYAGIYYHPIEIGIVKLGVVAGVMNGYPAMNNGNYFPAVLPTLSVEYKSVGANLYYIPQVGTRIYSVISLQLKFKISD